MENSLHKWYNYLVATNYNGLIEWYTLVFSYVPQAVTKSVRSNMKINELPKIEGKADTSKTCSLITFHQDEKTGVSLKKLSEFFVRYLIY